jgi:DNA invertase Pin-like site-specific DNA recombinase
MGRDGGLRLDGYVRVSQIRGREGDSFISPSVQRERIIAWLAAHGHNLGELFEELDESGKGGHRRPLLEDAIARIERGESDGMIVWKADRFGRDLIDGLIQIRRIRDVSGVFVSVFDNLDTSTSTGRMVLRIMLSIAENRLEEISEQWRTAKARAVARGIHPTGIAPFGYRHSRKKANGGNAGPLVPDPDTAPLVRELFQRRAAGAGPSELSDWLYAQGAKTAYGRSRFSHRAIKDILRNDVYIGVESAGADIRNDEAHEALIDRETFHAVQWRGVQFRPRSAAPSPIRPLLRCAGCRYAMRAERRAQLGGDVWYFTCRSRTGKTAWECDYPAAVKDDGNLERWIVDRFLAAIPRLSVTSSAASPRLDELEKTATAANDAFAQWRDDDRIQQRLGMDTYLKGLEARHEKLTAAVSAFERERASVGAVALPPGADDIARHWPSLTANQQRDLLRSAILCVFVRGSRRTAPLDGRLHLVWQGEDMALPERGRPRRQVHPFIFPDD